MTGSRGGRRLRPWRQPIQIGRLRPKQPLQQPGGPDAIAMLAVMVSQAKVGHRIRRVVADSELELAKSKRQ